MSWHYIYITTNKINGKKYLGQRKCPIEKMNMDKYLGSGTLLLKAIKKYGRDNFEKEIIYKCQGRKKIDQMEINLISKYECLENKHRWYNRAIGGQRWRAEGHTEAVSESMKKYYSNPRNRVKSYAAKVGMSVDEAYLLKQRKDLIKTLKKIKQIKAKEEKKIRDEIKEKKWREYLNSDEYKTKLHNKLKANGKRQSNSEEFKRKVAEGKAKALEKDPFIYGRYKPTINHKISLAKKKLGENATFIHHLFWDNNMTFGMLEKPFYRIFCNFVSGNNKNDSTPERIKYIHKELNKLRLKCTYKDLEKHAFSVKKESYKRERR